jgi:hypothetical protein
MKAKQEAEAKEVAKDVTSMKCPSAVSRSKNELQRW